MNIETLMKLRESDDAPFNHADYTVWLHNKIVSLINYELWEYREQKSDKIKSTYDACNQIMNLPSLKLIK